MSVVSPTISPVVLNTVVSTVVGGVQSKYDFNGTNQYGVTASPFVPLSVNWSRSSKHIPLTVDGTIRFIDGGATLGRFISAAGNVSVSFIDVDGSTVRTITGPAAVQGEQITSDITATATDTVLTVNGVPTASGFVAAGVEQQGITTIAALATPSNYSHGPIWDSRNTDRAPIQNESVNISGASLEGALPPIFPLAGTTTFDYIHKPTDHTLLSGTYDIIRSISGVLTLVDDEAPEFDLTVDGELYDNTALIDGQQYVVGFTTNYNYTASIDTIGPLPAGATITNLRTVMSDSPNLTWDFALNEGSGSAMNNSDLVSRKYDLFTNIQLQSNNITNPVQAPPPTTPPVESDWPAVPGADAVILFYNDWETGDFQQRDSVHDGAATFAGNPAIPGIVTVSTDVSRSGTYSFKSIIRKSDWASGQGTYHPRAQAGKPYVAENGKFQQNKEFWVGFSLYFDPTWQAETATNCNDIYWEMHGVGASNASPPLSLTLKDINEDGNYTFGTWLRAGDKNGGSIPIQTMIWDMGVGVFPTKGVWHDFIHRFRIAGNGTGYIEVWHRENGGSLVKVASYSGITTYWDSSVTPFKSSDGWYHMGGIYKPRLTISNSSTTQLIMYNDKEFIATGSGGGVLVDPEYSVGI